MTLKKVNSDLQKERSKCTFNIEELTNLLDTSAQCTVKRRALEEKLFNIKELRDGNIPEEFLGHKEKYENAIRKAVILNKVLEESGWDKLEKSSFRNNYNAIFKDGTPFILHFTMFIPTIVGQADDEQREYWHKRAINMEIIGTYAQNTKMDKLVNNVTTPDDISRVDSQCKVTTLRDLQKRRQILLAQKMIILKTKNQDLQEVNIEKDFLSVPETAAATNSTSIINPHILPRVYTAPEPTSSDEEIAQCDTFAISNSQKESLDLVFTDFEMVGSCIENIENQDINNLPYMNMINNQSIMNDNNCDLMNISTSELINISSNNLILTENNSRASPLFLPSQPETPMNVSLNEMNKELNITLSPTLDVDTCNVAEKHNSQFDGIAITYPISNENCYENLISVDQNNITIPVNEHTTLTNNKNDNEPEFHGDLATNKKRRSTVNKDTRKWKRIVNRDLRMKGEEYLGYRREKKENNKKSKIHHDVFKPARSIKPACDSTFCRKSKLRNCNNIDEDKRKNLFDIFWKTMSWEQRRLFICSHVTAYDKKQVKNPDSNRSKSLAYFLTIDNERHQVCKKMLLNTLGIKEWFVRYWLKTTDCAMPPPSVISRNVDCSKKNSDGHEHLQRFLDSLPKMPSHYCRANSSRQYLEPVFQTMAQLYKEYVSKCELDSLKCLSRRIFDNVFLKQNLSLFHPKKDQCDVCCGHKVGNINDTEIAIHRDRKDKARKEKDTDKNLAIEGKTCHVFTQDVQSVKLAPYLQASAIYYKTKLCVHNFTMYNLSTREACCYWFDESNGSLEASVFASCIVDQLQIILNRKLLPTEMGHGTFVRGLETEATYDEKSEEFVIHSPNITSYKWWPGGLGHTSNYCIVMAQLKIKGKSYGMQPFMVQIRDEETHMPLPGVKVGEIGAKLAFNTVNNGFLGFDHVRIPRRNMLMKYSQVLKDGTFKSVANSKLGYGTMVLIRVTIVNTAATYLARAVTVAVRYSAVRHQSKLKLNEPEPQILDYVTQQHKLFIAIATSYAYIFSSYWLWDVYSSYLQDHSAGNFKRLPELHALACSLKVISSNDCTALVERCRLSCGGHGFMLSSNLPQLYGMSTATCTYEGENTVLLLQTARSLVKAWDQALKGHPLSPTMAYLADRSPAAKWDSSLDGIVKAFQKVSIGKLSWSVSSVRQYAGRGLAPEDAWNKASVQLIAAAEAYGRAVLLSVYKAEIDRYSAKVSPALRTVLYQLLELYFIHMTLEKTGDLLLYTQLSEEDVKALQRKYEDLLEKIRPNAVGLVDAFDYRDEVLNSALGSYDGLAYEHLMEEALKSPLNAEPVNESFHKYLKPLMKGKL